MPAVIGLYMDVHIPAAVTAACRNRGIDALTAPEDGRGRASDSALLDRATELDRLLITSDADLLSIANRRQQSGERFRAVVIARRSDLVPGRIAEDLELLLTAEDDALLWDRVIYLPLS